jgi:hypothetical protein
MYTLQTAHKQKVASVKNRENVDRETSWENCGNRNMLSTQNETEVNARSHRKCISVAMLINRVCPCLRDSMYYSGKWDIDIKLFRLE